MNGGDGADVIKGNGGNDTVTYSDATSGVNVYLDRSEANSGAATGDVIRGVENIIGSRFDDILVGDDQANRLDGGGGSDILRGGAGKISCMAMLVMTCWLVAAVLM